MSVTDDSAVAPDTALPRLPADPSRIGRRALIAGAAAGAAVGTLSLPTAAGAVEPGSSYFQSISPTRICETRPGWSPFGFTRLNANTIRVKVAGRAGVAANAVAVALSVTMVNGAVARNWLSVYPGGTTFTGTSNMNARNARTVVSNLVTVKLGTSGAGRGCVDIRSRAGADVIVDVAGAYVATSSAVRAGRLVVEPTQRIIDTRPATRIAWSAGKPVAGQEVIVRLPAHYANAQAVVGNLTVVLASGTGHCTIFPTGLRRPVASNTNPRAGETRAVAFMCEVGQYRGAPAITVFTLRGAHILVDIAGYMTDSSHALSTDGLFVPMTPQRLVDTRNEAFSLWPEWTKSVQLPSSIRATTSAVAINLTTTKTKGRGHFTMHGAQLRRRDVSNLNATGPDQPVANHVIVEASTTGISCYARIGGEVIFDLIGRFTGTPKPIETSIPVNPSPPAAPLPWRLDVPRMAVSNNLVLGGAADPVVDAGRSWHWTGTGLVGDLHRNVVLFGHRTEGPAPWGNGGIYRFQHELRAGDWLYVYTGDNRVYSYRLAAEYVTSEFTNDILNHSRKVAGETVTLVSCTRTDRLPTSLRYRLVSTFKLHSWAETGR